ncbi:hypothetical protein POM88_020646 [Heracleum sosnowskyi]|uniref:Uncharacterized protein n=1 Tax=Heracleum sosnowskyi TaxID=360622 RepID=A0AAD8ICD0_9APIA|nr:hypothetical protein POM88_020646 [Heracleum sosnowskyi]
MKARFCRPTQLSPSLATNKVVIPFVRGICLNLLDQDTNLCNLSVEEKIARHAQDGTVNSGCSCKEQRFKNKISMVTVFDNGLRKSKLHVMHLSSAVPKNIALELNADGMPWKFFPAHRFAHGDTFD